ncbi:MAG: PLP-dependent aminotransferase family protein [Clostridia bacterium]|nr:PLP-dependent aminotransferase family protein [Clostridia bacterium]
MENQELRFASRFDGVTGSAIRAILGLLGKPGMISFGGGNPASDTLEEGVVAALAERVLARDGKAILQYGATEGYGPLKEALCGWFEQLGFRPRPEEVLPITGSTQGIDLIAKALIDPGDVVLVENPSFLGALQAFRLYQARLIPVPTDGGGLLLDDAERLIRQHKPKILYVIPTFQNPTGVTLAAERRAPLAQMAARHGVLVLEDDPYRDLRYAGDPLPAIKSYDQEGWVAHLSSFSKIISPGLRCGTLTCRPDLLRKAVIGKQSTDVHTSTLTQAIVAEYLRDGRLPAHLANIRAMYAARMHTMLDQLAAFPKGIRYTKPQGGLFLWAQLPGSLDATVLFQQAIEQNVAFVPGTHFFCDGGHTDTLRLNFSNSTPAQIDTGMRTLREVIYEMEN